MAKVKYKPKKKEVVPTVKSVKVSDGKRLQIRSRVWNSILSKPPSNLKGKTSLAKRVEAVTDHLAGMTVEDAAWKWGIPLRELMAFKARVTRTDPDMYKFLENMMVKAAIQSVTIFTEKADNMSAPQAAITAGIFSDKAVQLRKAHQKNFQDETASSDDALQRIAGVLERIDKRRASRAEVVSSEDIVDAEILPALPEKSSDENNRD